MSRSPGEPLQSPDHNASARNWRTPCRHKNARGTDRAGSAKSPCRNIRGLCRIPRSLRSRSPGQRRRAYRTGPGRARARTPGRLPRCAPGTEGCCPSSCEAHSNPDRGRAPWTPIGRPARGRLWGRWKRQPATARGTCLQFIRARTLLGSMASACSQSAYAASASLPTHPALRAPASHWRAKSSASGLAAGVRLARAASASVSRMSIARAKCATIASCVCNRSARGMSNCPAESARRWPRR